MKRKNGYTLIELIAVIILIGIILLIALPRVIGVSENSKKKTYITDAKRMITTAETKYKKDTTIEQPTSTTCIVFKLKDLEIDSLTTGPNNGNYDEDYSYVTMNYINGKYTYGIQLLEKYETNKQTVYRGVKYTQNLTYNDITNPEKYIKNTYLNKNGFMSIYELRDNYNNCHTVVSKEGVLGEKEEQGSIEEDENDKKVYYDYATNGGSKVSVEEKSYSYNEKIDLTPIAEKEGYIFVGWNTNKDAKEGLKSLYKEDESITLYAIYKKEVTATFYYYDREDKTIEKTCTMYNNESKCSYEVDSKIINSTGIKGLEYKGLSIRKNDNTNIEECDSTNTKYYAIYEGSFTLTYIKGEHVVSIGKENEVCNVLSLVDSNNKYQEPNCDITLPDFSVESGYKEDGYRTDNNTRYEKNTKYKLKENEKITAVTKDNEKPKNIVLNKNGDDVASPSKKVIITMEDIGSGLADSQEIKYGWSTTREKEPTKYNEITIDSSNSKKKEYEIEGKNLTGKYYLWVVPVNYSDKAGNKNTTTVISTNTFNFDPNVTVSLLNKSVEGNVNTREDIEIELTLEVEGLKEDIVQDKIDETKVYIDGLLCENVEVTHEDLTLKLHFSEENNLLGELSIIVPKLSIIDSSENGNKETSINTGIEFVNEEYTIEYELNEGELEKENPTTYKRLHEEITLNNPTKEYYEFKGWNGTDIEETIKNVVIRKNMYGDRYYEAVFEPKEYTIEYELNGGSFTSEKIERYNIEEMGDLPTVEKEGYEFVGWSLESNSIEGETRLEELVGEELRNIKIYAIYKKIATAEIYYYNGEGIEKGSLRCLIDSNKDKCSYEVAEYITTTTGPSTSSYYGLSTSKNSSSITSTIDSTKSAYYAVYKGTNIVSYDFDSGSITSIGSTSNSCTSYKTTDGATYKEGTCNVTLPTINAKTGYGNAAWYNGTTKVGAASESYTPTSEVTSLVAKAEIVVYNITYDFNGGSDNNCPKSYNVSSGTTLCTPTRSGYTFTGWTGSNGTTVQASVTIAAGSTGDKNYTANWSDTTTPTLTMIETGNKEIHDTSQIATATFGGSGGSISCINTTRNNAAVSTISSLALGKNVVTCTATGNNGKTASNTKTYTINGLYQANQLSATNGAYITGNIIVIPHGGTQYGPYVAANNCLYDVRYSGNSLNIDGATFRAYDISKAEFQVQDLHTSDYTAKYRLIVPPYTSGSGLETVLENGSSGHIIVYRIEIHTNTCYY